MTKEELKQEAEEWLCNNLHSASEEDFIKAMVEFAEPREKQIQEKDRKIAELEKENAELRKIAEFQQSSNMSRHFENKKLKEGLAVGSIFNKALNSMNKSLEEERDRYREMTFDMKDQLTNAKEIICECVRLANLEKEDTVAIWQLYHKAEQFLKSSEVEK